MKIFVASETAHGRWPPITSCHSRALCVSPRQTLHALIRPGVGRPHPRVGLVVRGAAGPALHEGTARAVVATLSHPEGALEAEHLVGQHRGVIDEVRVRIMRGLPSLAPLFGITFKLMRRERRPDVWVLRMAKLLLYVEPFLIRFLF